MKKLELVKGLELIIEGATLIKEQLLSESEEVKSDLPLPTSEEEPKEDKKVGKKPAQKRNTKKAEVSQEEQPKDEAVKQYTKEDLDKLKYNELKQLGASIGVPCTGKRDEITERILSFYASSASEESKEEEEPKEDKVIPMKDKKGLKKKKEDSEIDEEFLKQAEDIIQETEEADIKEALLEVGIKVTKKDDLKLVLAKALSEGLLAVDEDEEDEESIENLDEEETAEMEFAPNSYFEQFDPKGVNDPSKMTEERLKAIEDLMVEQIEAIESEEITEDQMVELIQTLCTEDELEDLGDDYEFEHLVAFYLEARKRMIDDEGNEVSPSEPYVINDENFCCGHELKYDKKHKKYICEVCGEEYDEE